MPFQTSQRISLDDGRVLVVQYEGERHGWACYIPGDHQKPTLMSTPLAALAEHLGYPLDATPGWMIELSERLLRELAEAPRYPCQCCGFRTLLRQGKYAICDVCGWEDDPVATARTPDVHSGPNHMTLNEARDNYSRLGAKNQRSLAHTRGPRANEHPEP